MNVWSRLRKNMGVQTVHDFNLWAGCVDSSAHGKLGKSKGLETHELGIAQYTLEGYLSTFSAKLQSSLDDAGCGVEQEGLDSVSANRFPTGEMAS